MFPSTYTSVVDEMWRSRRAHAPQSRIARTYTLHQCTLATSVDFRHHCPICLDLLHNALETPCGHIFCACCIVRALKISPTCPLDRNPLPQPPGLPIELFSLKYPDDSPPKRFLREAEAFIVCGAVSEVKDPMRRVLLDMRIQCPFREREGCMAELELRTRALRDHITEMRHGEGPSSNSGSTQTRPAQLPDSSPSTTAHCQNLVVKGDDEEALNTASRNDLKSKPTHRIKCLVRDLREGLRKLRNRALNYMKSGKS